jgi:hypothetical protein
MVACSPKAREFFKDLADGYVWSAESDPINELMARRILPKPETDLFSNRFGANFDLVPDTLERTGPTPQPAPLEGAQSSSASVEVAEPRSHFDCVVEAVTDAHVICWVAITDTVSIKTAFDLAALGGASVVEGTELEWDRCSNQLRVKDFKNEDILRDLAGLDDNFDIPIEPPVRA